MEGSTSTKTKNTVFILVLVIFLLGIFLYHGIYKMHFEFNNADVRDYINEEANKYPENVRKAIYTQIKEGVDAILDSRDLTKQVLMQAKINHTPREMELVHASIMQNKSLGYLNI